MEPPGAEPHAGWCGRGGRRNPATSTRFADADGNGVPDNATPVATQVTIAGGSYTFSGVAPGGYVVVEQDPAGYNSIADADNVTDIGTSPADVANASQTDSLLSVNLAAGEYDSGNDFVDGGVTVAGKVWDDANGSANNTFTNIPSPGESGTNAGGLYAILVDSSGSVVKSTAVNPDGTYAFSTVLPGTDYTILLSTDPGTVGQPVPAADLPGGWIATSPLTWPAFAVTSTNVTDKDFGIEQPPTADDLTAASQINPGGTTAVTVPALTGADAEDTTVTTFVIKTLPTNGTLYYNGTPVVVDTPITSFNPALLTVDPDNGSITVTFDYAAIDAAGVESAPATVEMPFTGLVISGNVFDDPNGLTDATVNGTGTDAGATLYANLVSGGLVVESIAIASDGSYGFANVAANTTYTVVLSTTEGTLGDPAPAASLPAGYLNTGETIGTAAGDDGTPDGTLTVDVVTTSVTDANFGIEQPPTADAITAASQANPGGTTQVTVPTLTGSDPEDPSIGTFVIKTLPTNGTLYYDGSPAAVDQEITDPALLTVDPDDGSITVTFNYSVVDAAGVESAPATVEMPFTGLSITGNVFNDANGLTDSTVNGAGTDAGATLYANLVSAGLVVEKVSIASDGTYSFPTVSADTTYTIVLSTTEGTIGSAPPAASLPPGYVNTGENLGAAAGDDGTIDGALTVAVTNASLTQANFGIEQPPTADPLSAPARPNLGGTVTYSVPALSGTDPEDPTLTTFVIRTLPTNGTLYYDGTPAVVDSPITGFDPAKLTVDPDDGTLTMTFSYSVIDAAEQPSPPALVEVPFVTGTLIINGQVRDDYDQNGLLSDPDRPVPGVTVSLYWDTDGDGERDNGEPLISTSVTDSTGYYLFENLSDGHYIVVETDPERATSTGDIAGDPTDNLIPVELAGSSSIGNDFLDAVDPTGYIYASATGQIIWGGSITVSGPSPATVLMDGTTGQYSFITDGTPGTYTLSFTPPTGWTVDPTRPAILTALDPTGQPDPYAIGSGENPANPGYLVDYSAATNTYYFTFDLAPGDPFVINNNIPLVEIKPTSWASWQYNNGLGGSNGPTQNPDGDSYDNLQEYAFCLPGNNGLNAHCPLEVTVNGASIDASITTVTGITDVTYTLEYIADLRNSTANGGGWTPVTTLIPTFVDNPDGTTTVTYADLESLPGLASGHGFVRVIVDLANPATTTRTYAAGWQDRAITENCETFSNPFLKCEIFSGAVTSNTNNSINLSGSIPAGSIRLQLINGRSYYAEVTAGPLVGNRWWIVNASSTATTIALSSGTTALTANALVGSSLVVREAHTFAELFPPADFHAGNSLVTADKILVYDPSTPSKWVNYFLADLSGAGLGIHWVRSTDPITNRDATPLDACQGIFIHHRAATVYTTQVGQVRENQFACPLKPGYNLVAGGFPVTQSTYDRAMTWDGSTFNGFVGSIDSARSDTLLFWKGDSILGAENYTNYWLVDAGFDPYRRWALQEDNSVMSQDTADLFDITRAAFYETETGNPGYIMPTGWTP